MNTTWDWTLNEFSSRIASSEPTPGGGSVAAVCGDFGLGLIMMALEITRRKSDTNQTIEDLLKTAQSLQAKLKSHADDDIAAFSVYMMALRLPKATDQERASRRQAISSAAVKATTEPLSAAEDMLSALELGLKAADVAKIEVLSDVGAGADILGGAVAATLRNVDINLPQLNSESSKQFAQARKDVAERTRQKQDAICAAVRRRITPAP